MRLRKLLQQGFYALLFLLKIVLVLLLLNFLVLGGKCTGAAMMAGMGTFAIVFLIITVIVWRLLAVTVRSFFPGKRKEEDPGAALPVAEAGGQSGKKPDADAEKSRSQT